MKISGNCNLFNDKNYRLSYYINREIKWFRAGGYRIAREDESACFNEIILHRKGSRWVTILEDSVEYVTTHGLEMQARFRQTGYCGTPAFLYTMIDSTALQAAFVCGMLDEPAVHISDPTGKNRELLEYEDCHREPIRADTELRYLGLSQEHVDDVWLSPAENQSLKLMALCDLLGLDYSVAKTGFTDFLGDETLIRHVEENYQFRQLSFCTDDRKLREPMQMLEGRPAMELLGAEVEPADGGFLCSLDWINRGGDGGILYFGLFGEEIDRDLKKHVTGQERLFTFSDLEVSCPDQSFRAVLPFRTKLDGDRHMYECEAEGFLLPAGVVIPARERRRLEKENRYHESEIPIVISTRFMIYTRSDSLEGITAAVMPSLNAHRGIAKYDF